MTDDAGDSRSQELAQTLLDVVLQHVRDAIGVDHVTFCRWESAGQRTLTVLGTSGSLTHPELAVTGRPLDGLALGYDLPDRESRNLEPVVLGRDTATPRMRDLLDRVGASSLVSVPVVDPSGGLWLLEAWIVDPGRTLPEADVAELRRFAPLAAAVLAHDAMAGALAESAQRWQLLVEQIPAITYITTPEGEPIYSSPQVQTLLGLRAEEWDTDYDTWIELVHPDDRALARRAVEGLRTDGRYDTEFRIVTPDGRVHWFADQAVYIPPKDGRPEQVQGVMMDVTARKRAEQALSVSERRREQLLAEMLRAEEAERRRIAEELHDDTIQVMTAALIQIDRLTGDGADAGPRGQVLAQVRSTLTDAVERTRRMTFRLRPPLLEAQGLAAAVRVLAADVTEDGDLAVALDVVVPRIGSGIEELAFRTVQEALTNVVRHAAAGSARVCLSVVDQSLVGEVSDDGVGFDVAEALDRSRMRMHLGLEAMRERIYVAGGELEIHSSPGDGTAVGFRLPLPQV
ncbi:MAG TPA: PAS domain-containing protein [Gaiellales bacterium]|nr:PAS domain-containing protein [Gaiellales bacterium]